jgi:hypothetical protein
MGMGMGMVAGRYRYARRKCKGTTTAGDILQYLFLLDCRSLSIIGLFLLLDLFLLPTTCS